MVIVREGTLDEAVSILVNIEELESGTTVDSLKKRICDKPYLVLVAEDDGQLLGVKVGYQLDDDCFYSWLGGVARQGRRQGIAQSLLHAQERWTAKQGYSAIRVKSRNQFAGMLCLLLENGYFIEHLEKNGELQDYCIHFVKKVKL